MDPKLLAQKRKVASEHRLSSKLNFGFTPSSEKSFQLEGKDQKDVHLNLNSIKGKEKEKEIYPKGKAMGFLDFLEEVKTFTIVRPDGDYEFLDYVPLSFNIKDIAISL